MFHALLVKCIEKEKYILWYKISFWLNYFVKLLFLWSEIITRVNTPPRLVALVPQAEELDEHRIQIIPPGFHVIYMPYADDFRQIDKTTTETCID